MIAFAFFVVVVVLIFDFNFNFIYMRFFCVAVVLFLFFVVFLLRVSVAVSVSVSVSIAFSLYFAGLFCFSDFLRFLPSSLYVAAAALAGAEFRLATSRCTQRKRGNMGTTERDGERNDLSTICSLNGGVDVARSFCSPCPGPGPAFNTFCLLLSNNNKQIR